MHNIKGAANQLFLKQITLQRFKNTTKTHYDDHELYKILNRCTDLVNFDLWPLFMVNKVEYNHARRTNPGTN